MKPNRIPHQLIEVELPRLVQRLANVLPVIGGLSGLHNNKNGEYNANVIKYE